jgi:hypothetical protein
MNWYIFLSISIVSFLLGFAFTAFLTADRILPAITCAVLCLAFPIGWALDYNVRRKERE